MIIKILRKKTGEERRRWQTFEYEPGQKGETIATLLNNLNKNNPDADIRWDCGCLQKKCGACAMVINGRPSLACGVKLTDLKKEVRIEPLRKFPVVEDLITDRSILQTDLFNSQVWLEHEAAPEEKDQDILYEASRCLQCGCCLEVCPNFMPDDTFFGMAAAIPMARLLTEGGMEDRKRIKKHYKNHVYSGCGKSLSCRDICPAGIDIENLLVRAI